jgi:CelD/BcsL family acetyltransferase involved in cellulose biosynthesis
METNTGFSVGVCRTDDELRDLRTAWEVLAERVTPLSPTQTFRFAEAAWLNMRRTSSTRLAVITVRRGEELLLVWPLFTERKRYLTEAAHLGFGAEEEYGDPLMVDDGYAAGVAALAIDAAAGLAADILLVSNVLPDSTFAIALKGYRAIKRHEVHFCYRVELRDHADFASWIATKSKSFRQGLRYDRRRLSQAGALRSGQTEGAAEASELVAWLFDIKRAWLDARGILESWIRGREAEAQFVALLSAPESGGAGERDVHGFTLRLDGRIVAGCLCLLSEQRLEYFITGYDPAFASYSPGNLLIEDCVAWAITRHVDFDFRMMPSAYKARWAGRLDRVHRYRLATSPMGSALLLKEQMISAAREAVRRALGPRGIALVKRVRRSRTA